MTDLRRALPSVGALLESETIRIGFTDTPHPMLADAIRAVVDDVRNGRSALPSDSAGWATLVAAQLRAVRRPSLRPVINATGVVLHTNLGRAPLARAAIDAIAEVAAGFSNLEYDTIEGARGSRYVHCAALLRELTGAEDALVVNNGAAALVLALNTLSAGREAILSRGELVEIGGSFRIHEIMERSGARVREVGATNRTHLADYARAIGVETGMLVKVHRSNFAVSGYTSEVGVRHLVPLAREHDVPILHDVGSGLLMSLEEMGLTGEPTAREALAAGASVVVMSGDKLLGGPQAGLVLGNARYVAAMRANPLARSYRVDKLTLAALEATLALYRDPAIARREIPVLSMIGAASSELHARAERIGGAMRAVGIHSEIVPTNASVGGGAFPGVALPSFAVALEGDAVRWATRLRAGELPVVGRVVDSRILLDLRTIPADADQTLLAAVIAARE